MGRKSTGYSSCFSRSRWWISTTVKVNVWDVYSSNLKFLLFAEVYWIVGCKYRKIIFCLRLLYPGLLAVLGANPRKEQQNCSSPHGQGPTLSFPRAGPPSEAGPSLLAVVGWQLCVWLSAPAHRCGAVAQFQTVSIAWPCFDLQHSLSVCQWDLSWRRGNGKLFPTCAPVLMGDVRPGTTAGPSCLCLGGSKLWQLPAAVLVPSVHLLPHCSLPALSSFLGVCATPLLPAKIPSLCLFVPFLTCPAFCGSPLCWEPYYL